MTDNTDKPTPAYVLNHAAKFSKQEIKDAWDTITERDRRSWEIFMARGASHETGENLAAIKAAIGG